MGDYLATGHPCEALFENWESELGVERMMMATAKSDTTVRRRVRNLEPAWT